MSKKNKGEPTGFIRKFDTTKKKNGGGLSDTDAAIYAELEKEIRNGIVFPAVRKGELHFYYGGGCLYNWKGNKLKRDEKYDKNPDYQPKNAKDLKSYPYKLAKEQNKIRFADEERQLLDRLTCHTFVKNRKTDVVVLDIEVCLNGKKNGRKKCDMVLLNTKTDEIMFVEGKFYSNKEVFCKKGMPSVGKQVICYKEAINEQRPRIIEQYQRHIDIINELFDTHFSREITILDNPGLLVYLTPDPENRTKNERASMETLNKHLSGKKELGETETRNTAWFNVGEEPPEDELERPTIDNVWAALTEKIDEN
ncbi:MAG: hypothetical protein FWF00_00845 [Endomicrobia bacterium]|nr:hypothetical protein [Endomicrobiia bacterium]MCL2506221.1 hypothetical protein [Endomicrobiia bacterium]